VLQRYRCEVIGCGIGDFKLWRRMFEPLHFSAWQGLVRIQQAIATMGRGQALLIRHSAGYELVATQLQLCEPAGDPMPSEHCGQPPRRRWHGERPKVP
jgi:hypothetical protein